ncbi:glycohydrolase toxin TNT-related protein [Poriferisphaera corsica]
MKPYEVDSGLIAPWFEQPRMGVQHHLPKSLEELLDDEIIKEINE